MRTGGDISDEDAYEGAIKAFAAQFQGSATEGSAPAAEAQGDADSTLKRSAAHLPEEELDRAGEA